MCLDAILVRVFRLCGDGHQTYGALLQSMMRYICLVDSFSIYAKILQSAYTVDVCECIKSHTRQLYIVTDRDASHKRDVFLEHDVYSLP